MTNDAKAAYHPICDKQKQKPKPVPAPVPNTPDEKGTISGDPGRRSGAVSRGGFFDEIKRMNSDAGLSESARRRLKGGK